MTSEPARARLLWAILSLALLVTFGYTSACRSPVVYWSSLMPNTLSEIVQETPHPFFFVPPHAARAPYQFSEFHVLRQSRVFHARRKPREQYPPAVKSRVDALTSRLHKRRCESGSCGGLGEACRSGTCAGSTGRCRTAVSSTSALSIRSLSSRGTLGRSYSSRAYFRKLHHALRMHRLTSMDRSAL